MTMPRRRRPPDEDMGTLHNGTLLAVADQGRRWEDGPLPEFQRRGNLIYRRQPGPGHVYHGRSNGYTIVQVIVPAEVEEGRGE